MMNNKLRSVLITAATATMFGAAAQADESRFQFNANAAAGARYDSNVALVDLDTNTGEPDTATVLDAGVGMTIALNEHATLRMGYDYSDTSYQQFSEYDLGLHHVVAEAAVNSRFVDMALTADRFSAVLDGDQYLTLTQISPSLSKLIGTRVFVRAAVIKSDKEYDLATSRNADSDALRLDTYFLMDGMQHYVSLGLQKMAEDAMDSELDYDGVQVALGYGHTFRLPLMQLQIKAQLRYEERDYLNNTASIDAPRSDERLRSSLTMSIPFTDHIKLEGVLEHTDNESNLDSAALDKVVYGLGLAVQF